MIWFGGKVPAPERFAQLCASNMHGHLGIAFAGCGEDWLRLRMPVDHRTRQPFGRLHGGASVTLAEAAGSMAGGLCVDPEQWLAVGMEVNANHIRPVDQGWVHATARPEALGRTTQVWSIRVEDEGGRLVCIARLTNAVIARDRT